MSPIYIPPSFCGLNAKLQLKKDVLINGKHLNQGEICTVIEVIGYAYMISSQEISFRIKMEKWTNIFIYSRKVQNPGR